MVLLTGGSLELTLEAVGNELVTPKVVVRNIYRQRADLVLSGQHLMGDYLSLIQARYRTLAHQIANEMSDAIYDQLVQNVANKIYKPDEQRADNHWEQTVVLPCWTSQELRDYLIDHIDWADCQDDWITFVSPLVQQYQPKLMDLDKETMWEYLQRVFQRDPVRAVRMTLDEIGSVVYDDLMSDGMLHRREEG